VTVTALVVHIQEEDPVTMAGVMIRLATGQNPSMLEAN
jgi:hypothetical protein